MQNWNSGILVVDAMNPVVLFTYETHKLVGSSMSRGFGNHYLIEKMWSKWQMFGIFCLPELF